MVGPWLSFVRVTVLAEAATAGGEGSWGLFEDEWGDLRRRRRWCGGGVVVGRVLLVWEEGFIRGWRAWY